MCTYSPFYSKYGTFLTHTWRCKLISLHCIECRFGAAWSKFQSPSPKQCPRHPMGLLKSVPIILRAQIWVTQVMLLMQGTGVGIQAAQVWLAPSPRPGSPSPAQKCPLPTSVPCSLSPLPHPVLVSLHQYWLTLSWRYSRAKTSHIHTSSHIHTVAQPASE